MDEIHGRSQRLYVVLWSDDGHFWWVVEDEGDEQDVLAVYIDPIDAERRRSSMAQQFPEVSYRVVGYEHGGELDGGG